MKRRFTALIITAGMLANQIICSNLTAFAQNGQNAYGHTVTYKPVTTLYTDGKPVKFFDAGVTEWGKVDTKTARDEAGSIKWLNENGYLLNRFGRKMYDTPMSGCFSSKGEWLTQLKGPRNRWNWTEAVSFDALNSKENRANGNVSNLYSKGDIQYFFSWKVKTVQTRWGLTGKSNDTGRTYALGEVTDSKGGGWKKYNAVADGPNLGNFNAWKDSKTFGVISFTARSDRDAQVDSYLSGAMLVGRDIQGPKISSVTVTADADGKEKIANNTITLDTVKNLKDRTVYFRVEWDEPVFFKNISESSVKDLTLKIDTIGEDSTSGMIAEAPFLKFAPSKTDGKPVMIFEYKISDPYTDTDKVTQERGFFYKFTNVTVSPKQNEMFWNNIYDISGNKFASDINGNQPAVKVTAPVGGGSAVDLIPFGIESIKISKKSGENSRFILTDDLVEINLNLNKALTGYIRSEYLPSMTLNVKNSDGEYVTITPGNNGVDRKMFINGQWVKYSYFYNNRGFVDPVMLSDDKKTITFYTAFYPECEVDGDSVKITSVSYDNEKLKDNSGYSLMNYKINQDGELSPTDLPVGDKTVISKYTVSPDKQYKIDYIAPTADISAKNISDDIILITADITDKSVQGCDASFTVKLNGSIENESIGYQASASESYTDAWQNGTNGAMSVSFSTPIVTSANGAKAYGFVKLPQNCEADKIDINVSLSDDAGNTASAQKSISAPEWLGYDTLAPSVSATVTHENINVTVTDMDSDVKYKYGFSDNDTDEPSYTEADGKSGIITPPDNLSDGEIHEKTIWITASDSKGNTSEIKKIPMKYDRSVTSLTLSEYTDKLYTNGEYPVADYHIQNAYLFWFMWIEKPANVDDLSAYITGDVLAELKNRAENYGSVFRCTDIDKSTEQYNNDFSDTVQLYNSTDVVSIVPNTDGYGEMLGENIPASETDRPLVLVMAVEKSENGETLIRTAEFNTLYNAPDINIRQVRFSTNGGDGKRIDYIRNDEKANLFWCDDEEGFSYPLNTPNLFGFAQAEFYLAGDPVTDLDRIDKENSYIALEKVEYEGKHNKEGDETAGKRVRINEWKFSELGFSKLSGGTQSEYNLNLGKINGEVIGKTCSPVYTASVDIDPKTLETDYYVMNDYGYGSGVRYEFVYDIKCVNSLETGKKPITYFAFNNSPQGYINAVYYERNGYPEYLAGIRDANQNTEAVFDAKGNDVTPDIPVYTFNTVYDDRTDIYVNFTAPFINDCDSAIAYFGAPAQNSTDMKYAMRIGVSPDSLSELIPFEVNEANVTSNLYYLGDYFKKDADDIAEVTLYYKFEYPERGLSSPVYVLTLRRDNFEPVFDISVSETERITNEVLVKINSITDTQTGKDGRTVVDTPESVLWERAMHSGGINSLLLADADGSEGQNSTPNYYLDAWRIACENDDLSKYEDYEIREDYDYETGETSYYIRVLPDINGFYHFTSNGYMFTSTYDNANNASWTALINGELVNLRVNDYADFAQLRIDNVNPTPPKFIENPVFTPNVSDGSFTVSAKAENTVKRAYLKFNDEYSSEIFDGYNKDDICAVENVPGYFSGELNTENGEINAKIYVKYLPDTPLSSVSLVIEDNAGNKSEYTHTFDTAIFGKKAEVTNTANDDGIPVYTYGGVLNFSVPVKLDGFENEYSASHENLPVYSDGIVQIGFTDLFGETANADVYADIFGAAFSHSLKFFADGKEILPDEKVNSDITVKIDTNGNENISVDGKDEFTFTENGKLTYSVTNKEIGQSRTFELPILNIDKTPPEAIVNVGIDNETDAETNIQYIYSVTYSVEGFSEDGAYLIPSSNGASPSSVTFDKNSAEKTYTFKFRDETGNENTYTADASDISFADRSDNKIASYRLTYLCADKNGFTALESTGSENAVNSAVSVKIEALNKDGETVSAAVSKDGSLPSGTALYEKEKLVTFTGESAENRTVNVILSGIGTGNSIKVPVTLPANSIDLTAPYGTVRYDGNNDNIKAYLVTSATDLAEDGVYVTGTQINGKKLELKKDENGFYTEFEVNGTGKFVMTDKAGNIGTVAVAVLTIDKDAPQIVTEGWQSVIDADTASAVDKLLKTPTNNSIKLFITFNEQISATEVKAYESKETLKELTPTDEYVTAVSGGRALTVEFKRNCQVYLKVSDVSGNSVTLWRPEDGGITVIDKDIPVIETGYPIIKTENNTVTYEYVFANGEEVMLLQDQKEGQNADEMYKNRHIVTFDENGQKILSFADRAGNVLSVYPVISQIDNLGPKMTASVDYIGDGKTLTAEESYKAGNIYTSKNVRILLNVSDSSGIKEITATTKSGNKLDVKNEKVTLNQGTADEKTYNYYFVVSENGSYNITAADIYGNENFAQASVSVIDRTAPLLLIKNSQSIVIKEGTSQDDAQKLILDNVTATDLQSGANSPVGNALKDVNDGVKISVDLKNVNLNKEGIYTAKITASDRLGNTAEKECSVKISKDIYSFKIGSATLYANDTYTAQKGTIRLDNPSDGAKYYYAKGHKTAGQMKYAKSFDAKLGFEASEKGYYTILAHESNKKMYLLYVYVY